MRFYSHISDIHISFLLHTHFFVSTVHSVPIFHSFLLYALNTQPKRLHQFTSRNNNLGLLSSSNSMPSRCFIPREKSDILLLSSKIAGTGGMDG